VAKCKKARNLSKLFLTLASVRSLVFFCNSVVPCIHLTLRITVVSCYYTSFKPYILTRKCIYRLPIFLTINSISLNNINRLFFLTQT